MAKLSALYVDLAGAGAGKSCNCPDGRTSQIWRKELKTKILN